MVKSAEPECFQAQANAFVGRQELARWHVYAIAASPERDDAEAAGLIARPDADGTFPSPVIEPRCCGGS